MTTSAQTKSEEFEKVEGGSFFKFEKIGDSIVGTLLESKFQESTVPGFKDQMVYLLGNVTVNGEPEGEGSERRVGIAKDYVNDKLKKIRVGQKVKIVFESEYQTDANKKLGMKPAKNLEVYAGKMDEAFTAVSATEAASAFDDVPTPPWDNK